MLHDAGVNGKLSGLRICPTTPHVTRLFFTDDSVLMIKVKAEEAVALKEILALYESCFGVVY